ncbi:MAG: hypothetical protein LBI31_07530 [Zoogloeaceae bacterium]|jgi:hypothetical protein|nr:hypothetical protein [Zoogloeaceae bacterium]
MNLILKKPHTHAGADYPAGAELAVPDADAAWLIERGIACLADGNLTSPPATDQRAGRGSILQKPVKSKKEASHV